MTLSRMTRTLLCSVALISALGPLSSLSATPAAEALLDAIDVFLSPQNMKAAGLSAERAEELLRDLKQRRYRRVRALGALSILAPERALQLLPQLLLEDQDSELRAQSAIHLARVFYRDHPAQVQGALERALKTHSGDQRLCELMRLELKRAQEQQR